MKAKLLLVPLAAAGLVPAAAQAVTYLSTAQAQALMFPGVALKPDRSEVGLLCDEGF